VSPFTFRLTKSSLASATALLFVAVVLASATGWAQSKKEFAVSARKYAFKVDGSGQPEIRVHEGDLVRITFSSEDIPHSFTLIEDGDQHYRIMKRAEPGKPVTFDFVADKPGNFQFQCTLRADDRCKEMVGTLVVEPKK